MSFNDVKIKPLIFEPTARALETPYGVSKVDTYLMAVAFLN
jgi:hypothetical protein